MADAETEPPKPFVSVRKWIKWGDDPRGENTDTLVLTSSKKYFVDIRIYLPKADTEASLPTDAALPKERLEWGFSGTASSISIEQDGKKGTHTQWTHWIDSKTDEEVKDEGDMFAQPNGEVLEYGAMVNPEKGVVERYEECWVDIDLDVTGERKGCWVLKTEEGQGQGGGTKGMIIGIGEWVQGVLKQGGEVKVIRARWRGGELVREGGVGKWELPREVRIEDVGGEGDTVEDIGGVRWVCVESFGWS